MAKFLLQSLLEAGLLRMPALDLAVEALVYRAYDCVKAMSFWPLNQMLSVNDLFLTLLISVYVSTLV